MRNAIVKTIGNNVCQTCDHDRYYATTAGETRDVPTPGAAT